ncbi:Lrp/AsnC ligand binding domain-containing protein [Candidatus Woesearchaeota archaeon]|nr:Lrp/AsnC ligand binding domain-containing protein [Candidatus Woesearchaeota archaeon]
MDVNCFILIKTKHGKNKIVARRLEKIHEIIDLNEIFGRYDLIIKVKTDSIQSLQEWIQNKLWITEGISNTETLIVSSPNEEPEELDDFD